MCKVRLLYVLGRTRVYDNGDGTFTVQEAGLITQRFATLADLPYELQVDVQLALYERG